MNSTDIWTVYKSPQIDMGYDISDYTDIDHRYGSLADVDELIAELGKRDMKLMMDLVVNHTSDQVRLSKGLQAVSKLMPYSIHGFWSPNRPPMTPRGTGTSGEKANSMRMVTVCHQTTGAVSWTPPNPRGNGMRKRKSIIYLCFPQSNLISTGRIQTSATLYTVSFASG